ncbi:MAG: endonuclease/exonuclease/phosphatase family protein [Myxococcota bacterium]
MKTPAPAPQICLIALLAASCEPLADTMSFDRVEAPVFRAAEPRETVPGESLRVMTWNLKFGGGRVDFFFDFWGDRVHMTLEEVEENMEGIYRLIREYDPDLLLATEVDVCSTRSAYVDMLQGILDNTALDYGSYHQSWDVRFAPYGGIGSLDMGNAILSKHPITAAESIRQRDRSDLPAYERYLYLHRVVGRAEIDFGEQRIAALVLHAEAYDQDGTKTLHLEQMLELMREEGGAFVAGGDFNELPPGSVRTSRFPDERASSIGTDFEQPPYQPEDMRPFFDEYRAAITLAAYGDTEESQSRYYTHMLGPHMESELTGEPGFWNRKLDYLFLGHEGIWEEGSTGVIQRPGDMGVGVDPMLLSDHAPVVGTWELP